jgi:predicted type IV restriction endonuclease
MLDLNLEHYRKDVKIREHTGSREIFSTIRKRWLRLTPEELVRQLLVRHFIVAGYPPARISEERQITVFEMTRRYDLVVFEKDASPFMLVECKAPHVSIDRLVFEQIARYNLNLRVPYLLVTNGWQSYCCTLDYADQSYAFVSRLPELR